MIYPFSMIQSPPLELTFCLYIPDCVDRLGMESGDILDNQITASSHRPGELPQYGRLNNDKYWCAGKKSKDEYFQVDLGQVSWKIGSCSLQLK